MMVNKHMKRCLSLVIREMKIKPQDNTTSAMQNLRLDILTLGKDVEQWEL